MNLNEQADKTMRYFCKNWRRIAKRNAKKQRAKYLRKQTKKALREDTEMPLTNRYDGWVT